jgi:hypothetical protein
MLFSLNSFAEGEVEYVFVVFIGDVNGPTRPVLPLWLYTHQVAGKTLGLHPRGLDIWQLQPVYVIERPAPDDTKKISDHASASVRGKELIRLPPDCRITFAGPFFQPGPIDECDLASPVIDEALIL